MRRLSLLKNRHGLMHLSFIPMFMFNRIIHTSATNILQTIN
jgi:hypothetical protein